MNNRILFDVWHDLQKMALLPVANAFERMRFEIYWVIREKGETVKYWKDKYGRPEIAITCNHPEGGPINELVKSKPKFLFYFPHDLVMYDEVNPIFRNFSALFLPNKGWYSALKTVVPRKRLYVVGWVKSDEFFSNVIPREEIFKQYNKKLPYGKNILFTPSYLRSKRVVKTMISLTDVVEANLVIKLSPTDDKSLSLSKIFYDSIRKKDNVLWIDPKESFFRVAPLGDILVSDQSSTLIEFMMTGRPSIQFQSNYKGVIQTELENLIPTIKDILNKQDKPNNYRKEYCKRYYIDGGWGKATINSINIILAIINSSRLVRLKSYVSENVDFFLSGKRKNDEVCEVLTHKWRPLVDDFEKDRTDVHRSS